MVLQLLREETEIEMYTKLCELSKKYSPKPLKMNYVEVGIKREVVILKSRVLMQVGSVHLDGSKGSYELLKGKDFCSKIPAATLQ